MLTAGKQLGVVMNRKEKNTKRKGKGKNELCAFEKGWKTTKIRMDRNERWWGETNDKRLEDR